MVNVIKNSVLHTYIKGDNTSVFCSIGTHTPKKEYEELLAHIIHINKCTPCGLWIEKKKKTINFSFAYENASPEFKSSKLTLDFNISFRNSEEFDWSFSNVYNYITKEIGYAASDFFRAGCDMPFISNENDYLFVHLKPNMLNISDSDIFGNSIILIDYLSKNEDE